MPFDKDGANTRRVLGTDNTGVELDGQVRGMVWDLNTLSWVKDSPGFASGSTVTITGTVNTVGGGGQATVNINGIPTVNVGSVVNLGTVPTVNVGNTVNVLGTATVNLGSIGTINVGNSVNLGTMSTVNVGNSVNLGTVPTINVGNTVTVSGNLTATTTIASAPTMNVGNSVNLGTVPTVNVGNTVNVVGTATVNIGSIGTINVGNTHAVTVTGVTTSTVNLGSIGTVAVGNAITNASTNNVIGQVTGRAAVTNPTAVADAATVQYMLDSLGRTVVTRAPTDLNESTTTMLTSSANTAILAGLSGLKHYIGTIGATMTVSMAGPTTLRIKNGGPSGALIWAWTFSGANPNMTPLDIDPVYANVTASFQITADLSASNGGLLVLTTGFKGP